MVALAVPARPLAALLALLLHAASASSLTAPTPKPSRGSRARRSTASKKKSYTESPPESEVVDMTVESDSEAPTPAKKRKSPAHKKASPKKPARAAKKPRQLATYDSDSDDEEDTVPKGWGGGDKPVRKSGRKR